MPQVIIDFTDKQWAMIVAHYGDDITPEKLSKSLFERMKTRVESSLVANAEREARDAYADSFVRE